MVTVGKRGFASAEWIVAVALAFLLVGLCAGLVTRLVNFGFVQLRTAEWEQRTALASRVLGTELRRGVTPADWAVHPGDSVRLRAFRGMAWICGVRSSPSPRVYVVFAGDRSPNAAKDSVLVLNGTVATTAVRLRGRRSGATCPGLAGAPAEEWDLGPKPPREGILRLFESGAYSVGAGALRYRVGRGGRQPVVGSTFDTASGLRPLVSGIAGSTPAELVLIESAGPYRAAPVRVRSVARRRRSLP